MRSHACRIAEDDVPGSKRSVAGGIGGTKDGDHRNIEKCREMQRSRVAADEQRGVLSNGHQLWNGKTRGHCMTAASLLDMSREIFFARTVIYQTANTFSSKRSSGLGITIYWPLFRSPTRTGV